MDSALKWSNTKRTLDIHSIEWGWEIYWLNRLTQIKIRRFKNKKRFFISFTYLKSKVLQTLKKYKH